MRRRPAAPPSLELSGLLRLWLLRMLVPLEAHREFVGETSFCSDILATLLGLGHWIEPDGPTHNRKAIRAELRSLHVEAERKFGRAKAPRTLKGNIARLTELVGLNGTDCAILEFAVLIHNERILEDTADWVGYLASSKVFYILSVILDASEADIRSSLSPESALGKSGLVSLDRSGNFTLKGKLHLLSDKFSDHILSANVEPISLLRGTVSLSTPPQLSLPDYAHIATHLEILFPYLKTSIASGRKGVNIFLHGDPGTGKSELTRTLAKDLGYELFEVSSEDADGDPVNAHSRLRAFRAAQAFFSKRKALILFDEVEDVFGNNDTALDDSPRVSRRNGSAQSRKAWINRMPEENPIPTFWLSNSVDCLDPAFIRRFDMVIELPVPPKRQRATIVREACGDMVDEATVSRIAESESLAPAVVVRAASVVNCIKNELNNESASRAIEQLISNTLEAQGHKPLNRNAANRLPDLYDPGFINSETDLRKVAEGLMTTKEGRICLYGPPGTGKTAYGRWLATTLGIPLLTKRASDLISMWVGGSEKNIARAFREAEQDGALLLIDEVDTFLQDRRGAQRSWEVSLVNEMLTQMESFPGVLVASTNLVDGLDQAALRRFDLKVKFGFLSVEQTQTLFGRYCVQLSIGLADRTQLGRLSRLRKLTPGDFAAVVRQSRFRPILSPAALISALEAECAMKEDSPATIGFLQ